MTVEYQLLYPLRVKSQCRKTSDISNYPEVNHPKASKGADNNAHLWMMWMQHYHSSMICVPLTNCLYFSTSFWEVCILSKEHSSFKNNNAYISPTVGHLLSFFPKLKTQKTTMASIYWTPYSGPWLIMSKTCWIKLLWLVLQIRPASINRKDYTWANQPCQQWDQRH